ncbi:MAG: choice-of-anchor D domain-containing protein [Bacteroidetes bacterium]|nr:MAG: choice-of-anchor D domain-containing protein [Bacteroidota bacterium]
MKSDSTSFFGRLFAILLMSVCIYGFANAEPKKVVLIEEFTGTWCPPCGSSGKPMMAQILEAHPNDVIGVELHVSNGDPFEIPENLTLAGTFGVSGVPCATVDRTYNLAGTGAMVGYVPSWTAMVNEALSKPAKVDVKLFYTINKSSRNLTANIEATFAEAASGNFNFNVFITEDDLIYDQAGVGPNYHHKHVMRDMLGDVWGTSGKIPSTVGIGQTYKHTYNFTIPAGWNIDNLNFIGVVQEYDATYADVKKILNCVRGTEGQPDLEFTCTAGQETSVKGVGVPAQREFEIKNLTNSQRTYTINVTKSSRTPSNWDATVILPGGAKKTSKDGILTEELIINAGANKNVTLQLTPGDMIGIGDAEISVKEKGNPSGTEGKGSLTIASAEIDKFQVIDDAADGAKSLGPTITNSGNTGYFDINADEFIPIYSQFNKLNTVVWTLGEEGKISDEEASSIKSIIDGGTPLLISGALSVPEMELSSPSLMYKIGCSWGGDCYQGESSSWNFSIVGYPNDPITDGFDKTFRKDHWITQAIDINNPKTIPILKHKFADTVVAVRSEVSKARIVLIGFNPIIITNITARNNLIGNSLKWLNGIGPKIASSVSELDFGDVAVNSEVDKTFDIENTGEETLNITEMTVDWEDSDNFLVVSPSLPASIQPGMSETVTIRFKPADPFGYDANMNIKSNAVNGNELIVNLKGNGTAAGAGAKIESNLQSVEFGEVPINLPHESIVEISNTGDQPLNIASTNIQSNTGGIFEVVSPASYPVTVQPAAKLDIKVKFAPSEKIAYTGTLEINSNATNGNKLTVPLNGTGGNAVGVNDDDLSSISLSAGPNPFSARTNIKYTVAGNGGMVDISVIDARGMVISRLVSKNLPAGEYSQVFDAKGLSSGMYYVIGKINGKSVQLPIVIEK